MQRGPPDPFSQGSQQHGRQQHGLKPNRYITDDPTFESCARYGCQITLTGYGDTETLVINAPADLRDVLDESRGKVALIRHIAAFRPGEINNTMACANPASRVPWRAVG